MSGETHRVTGLLLKWGDGDEAALNQLIPLVHDELRRMARRCLAGERRGHTLQATALVNEVSVDTVMRDWKFAKAWLFRELGNERAPEERPRQGARS